jgi:hypothetical protein
MNIKVLQWLLAHRDVLLKVVEVARNFSRHKPYLEQWAVIDQIARVLIPVLAAEEVQPSVVLGEDDGWDSYADLEIRMLGAGAELAALGIDWKVFLDAVLPIIIAILQALAAKTP